MVKSYQISQERRMLTSRSKNLHLQSNSNIHMVSNLLAKRAFLGCILVAAILSMSFHLTQVDASTEIKNDSWNNARNMQEPLTGSAVPLTLPNGKGDGNKSLEYIHCGAKFNQNSDQGSTKSEHTVTEYLLLHGAKFTKENWSNSGILDKFCLQQESQSQVSAVAIDLSVRANGDGFRDAFRALVAEGILSGSPVVLISPSASGKAIVSLASDTDTGGDKKNFRDFIKIWIPVASPAILSSENDAVLKRISTFGIQVLAINGDQDVMGQKVTKKLKDLAGAKGVELNGRHAVYLDSPQEFVSTVQNFVSAKVDQS